MRILLTGKSGQVGSALQHSLAPLGQLIATDKAALDLSDLKSLDRKIKDAKPDVIVNAAAYTAVDRAERERELALRVNSSAVKAIGEAASACGALVVHFSTDYVFDGEKAGAYTEEDLPRPINVYGKSKLAGERALAATGCRYFIFRTSWVYGPTGRNFLLAILAAARAKPALRVVNDQRGAPTSSNAIASAIARVLSSSDLSKRANGIFHLSAAGQTTWHGFAQEILARKGLRIPVVPISSAEHAAPAKRPKNSLLDNSKLLKTFGIALPGWREGLAAVLPAIH